MMNVDLIRVLVAVVAVGVGLAGLMLAGWRGVRHEMADMRHEMRHEMRDMRQEIRDMRNHMGRIDSHIGELRERVWARGRTAEGIARNLRPPDRVRLGAATFLSPIGSRDFLVAHWEPRLSCRPLGGATFLSPTGKGDFLVACSGLQKRKMRKGD